MLSIINFEQKLARHSILWQLIQINIKMFEVSPLSIQNMISLMMSWQIKMAGSTNDPIQGKLCKPKQTAEAITPFQLA